MSDSVHCSCGSQNAASSRFCSACGRSLQRKPATGGPGWADVWVSLGIAGLLAAVIILPNVLRNGPDHGSESMAAVAAESFVKRRLLAPATAQFAHETEVVTDGAPPMPDDYWVSGTVDSQNGFGAFIRTPWNCELHYEKDEYRLRKLTLDGRVVFDAGGPSTGSPIDSRPLPVSTDLVPGAEQVGAMTGMRTGAPTLSRASVKPKKPVTPEPPREEPEVPTNDDDGIPPSDFTQINRGRPVRLGPKIVIP